MPLAHTVEFDVTAKEDGSLPENLCVLTQEDVWVKVAWGDKMAGYTLFQPFPVSATD